VYGDDLTKEVTWLAGHLEGAGIQPTTWLMLTATQPNRGGCVGFIWEFVHVENLRRDASAHQYLLGRICIQVKCRAID
jgi:hypothetical protein